MFRVYIVSYSRRLPTMLKKERATGTHIRERSNRDFIALNQLERIMNTVYNILIDKYSLINIHNSICAFDK